MIHLFDLAADPGKHSVAFSVFDLDGTLQHAAYVEIEDAGYARPWVVARSFFTHLSALSLRYPLFGLRRVMIERPRTYEKRHQKGDQEDIHDVSLVVGAVASIIHDHGFGQVIPATIELCYPFDWKGNIPKPVTARRVAACLTPEEAVRIEWPRLQKKRHNVLDAIHIGLRTFTNRRA